ncbi:MAG TPA: DUF4403 family protein [Rhizomicrobium sp.]|jgi:hypothetical protein
MRISRAGFLLLAFALSACAKFTAPEPARTPPPPTPPIPVSTVTASLTIPMSELLRAVNTKTATEIARLQDQPANCGIGKCKLDLVATRTGPITGSAQGGRIALAVPFHIDAQVKLKSLFKAKAQTSADGQAQATTQLSIGHDWRIASRTEGTIDLSNAEVHLGPLSANLTQLFDRNEQHLSDPLFKSFDKRIPDQIKIRPAAEKFWARAFQPIRVGKRPQAWLLLSPQRALVGQPTAANGNITAALGIEAQARVVLGDEPQVPQALPPLPAPGRLAAPSNRFSFVVPVSLPYDQAAKLALARLQKKPPRVSHATVKIETLEILPSGEDVIVKVKFCVAQNWDWFGWFDSCGQGYLRGKPVFDSTSGSVRIANVHYDVATQGLVLSAMKFLAGDELGKQIEKNLVFNVAGDLAKLDDEVKTALAKPEGKGVVVHGTVERFGTPTLTWTDTGFLAVFPAEGTVSVNLDLNQLDR